LIKGYSKSGEIDRAMKVYNTFKPLNTTYILNSFIEALLKRGLKEFALEVFDLHLNLTEDEKFIVDSTTFATMAKNLMLIGDKDQAFNLISKISNWGNESINEFFNSLLDGCIKSKQLESAFAFIERMDKSVKATTIVFNSLIDCCIKQDMIEKAWSLFEEMTSRSIETDSFTYSTLIKGICLSNSEKYLDRGIELVSKVIED